MNTRNALQMKAQAKKTRTPSLTKVNANFNKLERGASKIKPNEKGNINTDLL